MCLKDWQEGKLKSIEEKWMSERDKWKYISNNDDDVCLEELSGFTCLRALEIKY